MHEEIDLYGIFIPGLLLWAVCAFVLSTSIRRFLSVAGFYRAVWHPALFDFALFVLVLACIVLPFAHPSPAP